jgi:hypothetical protein
MSEDKKNTNYMSMKDPELLEIIKDRDLAEEDYRSENGSINRKRLNNVLKAIDLATGKATEALISEPGEAIINFEPQKRFMKGLSGMMVQITFYSSDENDLPYVQMALNGIALMVPREKETWIPKEFIDGVLVHAVTTRLKMHVTPDGKIKYIPKQVPRIQYTVKDIKHIDVLRKEFDKEKKNKK